MNINQQMNLLIHLPLTLTCHTLSNLFDIEVIQETLLTIFSVMSSQKTNICGNITAAISDHLPQFLISPNSFANPPSNKYVFERDCSKFWPGKCYLWLLWYRLVQSFEPSYEKNVDLITINFLSVMNSLLSKCAPSVNIR